MTPNAAISAHAAPIVYLFDIDGTLLDAAGAGRRAVNAAFTHTHGWRDATAGIGFGGRTDRWIIATTIAARAHREATAVEIDAVLTCYLNLLAEELRQRPPTRFMGIPEMLGWLRGQPNTHLGIATGNVRVGADIKLEACGLAEMFAFGGWGCDSADRAALVERGIQRAAALLTVAPSQLHCIVVGDTVHDITAARANGATACAVTSGGYDAAQLSAADVVFTSLAELPRWHTRLVTAVP